MRRGVVHLGDQVRCLRSKHRLQPAEDIGAGLAWAAQLKKTVVPVDRHQTAGRSSAGPDHAEHLAGARDVVSTARLHRTKTDDGCPCIVGGHEHRRAGKPVERFRQVRLPHRALIPAATAAAQLHATGDDRRRACVKPGETCQRNGIARRRPDSLSGSTPWDRAHELPARSDPAHAARRRRPVPADDKRRCRRARSRAQSRRPRRGSGYREVIAGRTGIFLLSTRTCVRVMPQTATPAIAANAAGPTAQPFAPPIESHPTTATDRPRNGHQRQPLWSLGQTPWRRSCRRHRQGQGASSTRRGRSKE